MEAAGQQGYLLQEPALPVLRKAEISLDAPGPTAAGLLGATRSYWRPLIMYHQDHTIYKSIGLLVKFTARGGLHKTCSDWLLNLISPFQGDYTRLGLTVSEDREPHILGPRSPSTFLPAQGGSWPGAEAVAPSDTGRGWPPWDHLKDGGDRQHGHSRARTGAYGPADLPPRLRGTLLGNSSHTAWAEEKTHLPLDRSPSFGKVQVQRVAR